MPQTAPNSAAKPTAGTPAAAGKTVEKSAGGDAVGSVDSLVSSPVGNVNGSSAGSTGTPTNPASAGKTLLLVDDDDATRVAMSYILSHEGFIVEEARNGQDAVAAVAGKRFDMVLMDIDMPKLDGVRALAMIRRSPLGKNLPVIMLSKNSSREQVTRCLTLGARDFVAKHGMSVSSLIGKINKNMVPESSGAGSSGNEKSGKDAAGKATEGVSASVKADGKTQASAAAGSDDTHLDAKSWKEKAETIGRTDREKSREILASSELPSIFPGLRGEVVMGLKAGPSAAEDVVRAIEQDPAMVVEMLDHANKAQTGNTQAMDIDTAVHWIGRSSIEELLKAHQGVRPKVDPKIRPYVLSWWRHSIAVAQIAGDLALLMKVSPTVARVAGVLHDIGRLQLLASPLSDKLIKAYELCPRMNVGTSYAEQTLLGTNHKQVGAEFCVRHHVPAELAKVCETHDADDTARERMDEKSAAMSALIGAADQLAKAAGYGNLPNEELLPMPGAVVRVLKEQGQKLEQTFAEVETLCLWRLGSEKSLSLGPEKALAGMRLALVTPVPGPWNPLQRCLARAEAVLTVYPSLKDLMDNNAPVDAIVVDYMDTNLSLGMPMLRRLCETKATVQVPKLLLARRTDEPEARVSQAMLSVAVYATPVRQVALTQMIRRLITSQ
jgi:putative nucleotidyltransferase with HDIG domain